MSLRDHVDADTGMIDADAEAAGPRAGCGPGIGQRVGADRGELGGGEALI